LKSVWKAGEWRSTKKNNNLSLKTKARNMSFQFRGPFETNMSVHEYAKCMTERVFKKLHELTQETNKIDKFLMNNAVSVSEFREKKLKQKSLFVEFLSLFLEHAPGLSFRRLIRETTGESDEVMLGRIEQEFASPEISEEELTKLFRKLGNTLVG
jgi:hypothetical protein